MSVRCGYCYEVGHNRRTCPSYKKNLKRAAENGNPYAKQELNKKIVRTCGYCSRSGHDKRTCEYLKRDTNRLAAINLEVRKRIQKKAQDFNFGVGTLVSGRFSNWSAVDKTYQQVQIFGIIKKIDWERVDIHSEWDNNGSSAWSAPVHVECFGLPDSSWNSVRKIDFPFEISYLGEMSKEEFPAWRMRDELEIHNAVFSPGEGESSLTHASCHVVAKELIKAREWQESYVDRNIQRCERYLGITETLTSQE